jgi:hypothetical protein
MGCSWGYRPEIIVDSPPAAGAKGPRGAPIKLWAAKDVSLQACKSKEPHWQPARGATNDSRGRTK